MFLLGPIALLSVFACSRSHELFTDTVPKDFYLRKDLTDCSARFHKHKIFQQQCLVFGGVQANLTEFPHMAVLGWPEPGQNGSSSGQILWQCGGSLITERFVLTAAHCAADTNNIPPRLVRLGDVNLAASDDDEYAQQFEIRRIVRHPEHWFSRKYFDLALVELDGVARFTAGVCPACLWTKQALPAQIFETAGFGAISFGGAPVPNLLKTTLRTMSSTECTKLYKNTRGLSEGIVSDQMCAFELDADTCQGDSGGPLQVSLRSFRDTQPFVVALTSFGRGCGTGSSGVYQRVASHIPWIESVVNETMDPVRCSEKYAAYRHFSLLAPECAIRNAYINRVHLLWPAEAKGPPIPCGGTFIDYNTVVTSARCVHDADGVKPNAIELLESLDKPRAKIVEIQVHPEFDEISLRNDLALIRLEKYLQPDIHVAPSCIPLPKPTEICTDRQTHDPVTCWDQLADTTKMNLLNPICSPESIERSTVKLVWSEDNDKPPCVGMLIKTDTVITSIRCMNNHSSDPPVEIELTGSEQGKRVKIDTKKELVEGVIQRSCCLQRT
uniref:Peptidase S1 domain-containing protein n=1 Tax=Anopheles atroparvus TaxID=41427 RepID=A0A182J3U9_ANOAO